MELLERADPFERRASTIWIRRRLSGGKLFWLINQLDTDNSLLILFRRSKVSGAHNFRFVWADNRCSSRVKALHLIPSAARLPLLAFFSSIQWNPSYIDANLARLISFQSARAIRSEHRQTASDASHIKRIKTNLKIIPNILNDSWLCVLGYT